MQSIIILDSSECVLSHLTCVQLYATLWIILARSFVRGILQGRILEWVATPHSRASSWPRD